MTISIERIDFHGQPALRLHGPQGSEATVSLFGAQVLSWRTPDGRERLYLSEQARFDGASAIRGGVPVCFPQFGTRGPLPRHGLVRTRAWLVASERSGDDYALLTLACNDDADSRALWPHAFGLELTVMLEADRLDLELCVTNPGERSFDFTAALHTYLRVVQVEDVAVEGLYGHHYRDALADDVVQRDSGTELCLEGATDRIYRQIRRPQLLRAGNLSLGLQQQGFPDTVLWNPWATGCAATPDLPADDWRHFLCIEAAAADTVQTLAAGEEWYGRQTLLAV
jgi:glucose-6-phosphate 1-epimerase